MSHQSDSETSIGCLTSIGMILGGWLLWRISESFLVTIWGVFIGFVLILVLIAGASTYSESRKTEAAQDAQKSRIENYITTANRYADVLVRKRKQLIYIDDYGDTIIENWSKELERFAVEKLNCIEEDLPLIMQALDNAIVECSDQIGVSDYDDYFTGIEYEHYCADLLNSNGWKTSVSQASGDQGVDILAEKNGVRVAIQCKKYSSPVGNKAVQEVFTGKPYYGADHAVVVSNNTFTPSAQTLANTTNVRLMHHDDLHQLDNLI